MIIKKIDVPLPILLQAENIYNDEEIDTPAADLEPPQTASGSAPSSAAS